MGTRLCELCSKRSARYVCQECSRNVCERCLEPHTWLCTECCERLEREAPRREAKGISPSLPSFMSVFLLGSLLIFAGMVIIMIATVLYGLPDSLGLIVFIGPIPIVLGAGEYSFWSVILAIILTVLAIAFFIILGKEQISETEKSASSAQNLR